MQKILDYISNVARTSISRNWISNQKYRHFKVHYELSLTYPASGDHHLHIHIAINHIWAGRSPVLQTEE